MTLQTPTETERTAPHDAEAERYVLGSLLIDRDAIFKIADLLRVEDFYVGRHQRIYGAAQDLLERRERIEHPFEVSGVASAFREIDGFTEGFNPGDLIILAARPSVGKTSLGLAIAHHVARHGETALVFSLEMDTKQIVARFLGLNSRV